MGIATLAFLWFLFTWNICFHPHFQFVCVPSTHVGLLKVAYTFFFLYPFSQPECLWLHDFVLLYLRQLFICISLLLFCYCFRFVFLSLFSSLLLLGFDDYILCGVWIAFFSYCVLSIVEFWLVVTTRFCNEHIYTHTNTHKIVWWVHIYTILFKVPDF